MMSESLTRSISGIVYIALLLGATLLSSISFKILFVVFMFIAVHEYCRLAKLKTTVPFIITLTGFVLFGIVTTSTIYENLLLNAAALFVSVGLVVRLFGKSRVVVSDDNTKIVQLIGYVIIPFLLIIKLPFLGSDYNPYVIVGMFVMIWANDTFAYIVGKSIGKNKLFERISPKKTIEGFLGGVLFTVAGAYILGLYFTFLTPLQWMGFAAIVAVFGTLGDLVESQLKRKAGVKDSGNIMPGHGGVLDRLDSVIFAVPFLFLYYQIILYVS